MLAPRKTCSHFAWPVLARWPARAPRAGLAALGAMFAVLASASEGATQPDARLGTLFYSAAERNAINRARQGSTPAQASNTLVSVTGLVKRERGKSTVWINRQPIAEGQSFAPAARTTISATGVTLNGQRLRVGETLDINTRERTDIAPPGAVSTKSRK